MCLCVLSVSLVGVDLQPGRAGLGATRGAASGGGGGPPGSPTLSNLFRIILIVCLALVPVSIVFHLWSPEGRRRLVGDLIALALILALYGLLNRPRPLGREGEVGAEGGAMAGPVRAAAAPPEAEAAPPAWLVRAIAIGLSLAAAAPVAAGVAAALRRRHRLPAYFAGLGEKAEDALASLRAGANLRDVIIRCYAEMTETVYRERGISRDGSMTPREFERVLETRGLPSEAVRRLTRVFEEVRYGGAAPGPESETDALALLEEIASACRRDA